MIKKILAIATGLTALALSGGLVLGYTGIPDGFTFAKNLSSGMHDSDVVNLKTVLAAEGCVSGLANTDYFASKTLAGVKCFCNKYKAEISTSAGYTVGCTGLVGTGVRAKLNALIGGAAPGATPTPTPAGATEGTYTVLLSATPVSRTVNGGLGLEAYGIDIKAINSDITIGKIDLQTAVVNTVTLANMNPGTVISAIKVYDGSVADANLKATYNIPTYTLDPNAVWYTSLTGMNFVVPKGETKKVLIVIDTSTAFDQNRQVTINVYGNNGIRGRDTAGIDTYAALATTRVLTIQRPGNGVLTLSTSSTNPDTQNIYSDPTVGVQTSTPVLAFSAKATAGDTIFTRLELTYGASAGSEAIPNILYMYAGDTLVASATPNIRGAVAVDRVAVFSNFQKTIAQDQTVVFTVKATWPVILSTGNNFFTPSIPAVPAVTDCAFFRADGSSVACTSTAIIQGNTQRLFEQGVKLALVSKSVSATAGSETTPGTATGVIKFSVQPFGGTLVQITGASAATEGVDSVLVDAIWASGSGITPSASGAGDVLVSRTTAQDPARNLNDGETGTVTVGITVSSDSDTNNQYVRFAIEGVQWTVGANNIYQGMFYGAENGVSNLTDNWFTDRIFFKAR